jgi:hypothetical protein
MDHLNDFSREDLLKLLEVYAANWLAHDGCWFLAAEEALGMDAAIALDAKSWERFAPAEARRIMKAFGIPKNGGLDALEQVLRYRLYAAVNVQAVERVDGRNLRFRMLTCRVQETRARKGLPDFPCRPVGEIEFSGLVREVDPRIRTRCLSCPPDTGAGGACSWEFTL